MNWIVFIFSLHALYISVIEIDVKEDSFANVIIKIFSDDLSDAVREADTAIIPREGEYDSSHLECIESYFNREFFIHNNYDTIRFDIIDYTSENQTVWLNLKSRKALTNDLQLTASFLLDIFPDQVNMVQFKTRNQKQFFQIKKGKESVDLNVDKS